MSWDVLIEFSLNDFTEVKRGQEYTGNGIIFKLSLIRASVNYPMLCFHYLGKTSMYDLNITVRIPTGCFLHTNLFCFRGIVTTQELLKEFDRERQAFREIHEFGTCLIM